MFPSRIKQFFYPIPRGIQLIKEGKWRFLFSKISVFFHTANGRDAYVHWMRANEPSETQLELQTERSRAFAFRPTITFLLISRRDQDYNRTLESLRKQTYENWQIITDYQSNHLDPRIRSIESLDSGVSTSSEEFVGAIHGGDELPKWALYEIVQRLQKQKIVDLIYSDEDSLDRDHNRIAPRFKPDWSPDFLGSSNYVGHLWLVRKDLCQNIRELNCEYDFLLRIARQTLNVLHIPRVLYHRAAGISDVTPQQIETKLKTDAKRSSFPKIGLYIPSRDHAAILKRCIDSIHKKSTYPNYETVVIDNGSTEPDSIQYFDELTSNEKTRVIRFDQPFNFSAINNHAVSETDAEILVFLNNDTEIIAPHWLEAMLQFTERPDVGAVGAKLYYPDQTIQHAGIAVGFRSEERRVGKECRSRWSPYH